MKVTILCVLLLCWVAVSFSQTCSQTNCGGNPCCYDTTKGGARCYASNYQCIASGSSFFLCGVNESLCGSTCYNPNYYQCLYDSTTQTEDMLCPVGFYACGSACYDYNAYSCNYYDESGPLTTPILCPASQYSVCSKSTCYNPNEYACCSNNGAAHQLFPISAGNVASCNGQCYNPTQSTCNYFSFNSTTSEYFVCPLSTPEPCGAHLCYNQTLNTCCADSGKALALHPVATKSCQNKCYNPSQYVCANTQFNIYVGDHLCPISQPAICGTKCYDPTKKTCCGLNPSNLYALNTFQNCQMREDIFTCINPLTTVCCPNSFSHDSGSTCPFGLSCCGVGGFVAYGCYNSTTQACCIDETNRIGYGCPM